jgi:hypothetical protein
LSTHSLGVSFAVGLVAGVFPVHTTRSPDRCLLAVSGSFFMAQVWGTQSLVALPLGMILGGNVAVLASAY